MTSNAVRRVARFVFLSDADARTLTTARYGWRLVAANNRPLGRGVRAEASLDVCRDAAQRVHEAATDAVAAVQFDPGRGHWAWRVALGGTTVAVCVHPYLRRVECLRGLEQFLAAVRLARPDDGVVRYFGPRTLRAYDAEPVAVEL
jgi:hypothetical protein